jgi:hypothetical protein
MAAEFDDHAKNQSQLQKTSYPRELRAVGQALEARHVVSVDLELKGGLYVVRGKVTASDYAQSSLWAFVQDFISGSGHSLLAPLAGHSMKSVYLTIRRTSKNLICKAVNPGVTRPRIPIGTVWRKSYAASARSWIIVRKPLLREYRLKIVG